MPINTVFAVAGGGYGKAMNARQTLGRAAEQTAADYLTQHGWHVIGRNVRVGRGELDIVARRERVLAFIEVKARRTTTYGSPEDAVHQRKRRQVVRLAELWLASRPWALAGIDDVRYDVIAVHGTPCGFKVRHLPGAFSSEL